MLKLLIGKRTLIQIAIGLVIFILVYQYKLSLWYLVLAGAVTGVVFGKVFCRWMCPMGVVMEFMMGLNPDQKFRQMYQYHKLGCPIAWIQGALNRFSLLGIKVNYSTCKTVVSVIRNVISQHSSHQHTVFIRKVRIILLRVLPVQNV
ncbi:MAG: 4Fe-4S binding protein [Bacteroidales bacterium]|nr:4Fe-4S binding protein [Bacteroidales bacterium]